MKKRILSILLCLVMVVGLLPTTALAAASIPGTTGAGRNPDDPVVCDNYKEFKAAMESQYIRYVKFQGKDNFYEGNEGLPSDYDNKHVGATVSGPGYVKNLIIEGIYQFYATSDYQCLLRVPSYCTLHVSGNGTLKYLANSEHEQNALIYNEGTCKVEGDVKLIGTYNSRVYGYAITSAGDSTLEIKGGTFTGGAAYYMDYPYAAVHAWGGAKVNISGGTFRMEANWNELPKNARVHSLNVDETVDCTITGGTFESGIYLNSKLSLDESLDIRNHSISDLIDENCCIVGHPGSTFIPIDSTKKKTDDKCEVQPKPTVSYVKVGETVVDSYGDPIAGYGETTVKANKETTVTAVFSTPSWIRENNLTLKPVLFQVGPDGGSEADVKESTRIESWDGVTATVSVKFTPEAGKTYTLIGALGVYSSESTAVDSYLAIAPSALRMDVETPPDPLTGTVTYTGAARYGATLTANVTDLPEGVNEDDLNYQWQQQSRIGGKNAWIAIRTARDKTYTPSESMVGKTIRVMVWANDRSGVIYGAAKKVEKAFNYGTPFTPELSCTGTTITVDNYKNDQEYRYHTVAPDTNVSWPETAGAKLESESFTGEAGQTYYVYTRIAATDTTLAGTTVRVSSITVPTADEGGGEEDIEATGLIYPDYPTTPRTIYVEKDKTVEVKYQITPANANKKLPEWKERTMGEAAKLEVTTNSADTTSGIGTITIKGTSATTSNGVPVTPYESGTETQWGGYGNTYDLTVVVYDPADLATIPLTYTDLGSVDLYVEETYDLNLANLKTTLDFLPDGVSPDGYTLKAYVLKRNLTGAPSYESSDSCISIDSVTGVITANAATTTGSVVYVVALAESETASVNRYIATLTVNVEAKPTVELESITVNPPSLALEVGSSKTLTAIKNPINAADGESITWTSSDDNIATVDSTGKVTAAAVGTATITATCDSETATCTVNVVATGHEHSYTWAKQDEYFHKGTCGCGKTALGSHDWKWVVDTEATADAAGQMHEECTECKAKRNENTEIPKLTFTVTMNGSGTGATGAGNYAKDATVAINAGTKDGYTFKNWTSDDGVTFADANSASTSFTMPAKPVTVTANWTKNSSGGGGGGVSTYTITVENAKHGDVTADRKSASSGTTVTITVAPDKGYDLETLTVLDKNGKEVKLTNKGNGKYTFKMPASKVTVKAAFAEDNSMLNFFVDVPADAYYADAVLWAAKEGITGGVDAVHFAPDMTCTRAQAVTFLWRAAGSPAPKSTEMPFADVKADSYYYNAVLWAVENGITKGTSETTFSPDVECSRAQIVTFLWRSQKSPAVDAANPFVDVIADAYYADAVLWAAANGITGGTTATTFSPDADCTRAQIVTFIYRCMK